MKSRFSPFILAAALVALSAPVAMAEANAPAKADAQAVPDAVKVYVTHMARSPYPFQGEIKVGRTIDAGEVFRKVPQYNQFSFANLGGAVVVIDTATQKVLAVY